VWLFLIIRYFPEMTSTDICLHLSSRSTAVIPQTPIIPQSLTRSGIPKPPQFLEIAVLGTDARRLAHDWRTA
jgi:hypothetical protein